MSDYAGEDLILATGAPGSGWSGALRTVSFAAEVNNSDITDENVYNGPSRRGHHYGAYFGPHEKYGDAFTRLDELAKDELVAEFRRPYRHFDGIKIIKSHQFAYHLDHLAALFPKAHFACCFRETDELTFDWWHKCGGWNITHPRYEWYRNDERMRRQIELENRSVRRFATRRGMRVFNGVADTSTIFASLGLTFSPKCVAEAPPGSGALFASLSAEERYYKVRFGTSLNNDPYLYMAVL